MVEKRTVKENIINFLKKHKKHRDSVMFDIELKTEEIIKYIGIPIRYLDMKIRSIEEELLEEYINNEKGLYLWGPPGIGKTTFACILISELLNRYPYKYEYPKFLDMRAIKYEIEYQYQINKTLKEIIDTYTDKKLLVFDDFGAVINSESYFLFISYLINNREQNNRRTIITSNKDLNWISNNVDDRIASRIIGMCDIIKYSGQDERLKNAKTREIIVI